jgi:hypothetical protein
MNVRAIPGANLFRLYVCDKEEWDGPGMWRVWEGERCAQGVGGEAW